MIALQYCTAISQSQSTNQTTKLASVYVKVGHNAMSMQRTFKSSHYVHSQKLSHKISQWQTKYMHCWLEVASTEAEQLISLIQNTIESSKISVPEPKKRKH